MRNTSFNITVPHILSPKSALNVESNSYIIGLRFNIHGALQINQHNYLTYYNNAFFLVL